MSPFKIASCLAAILTFQLRAAEPDAVVAIDAAKSTGPVNRMIFGQNLEAADARGIFSLPFDAPKRNYQPDNGSGLYDPRGKRLYPEYIELFRKLRVGAMRYPGGCLAHNFNWKDAVGPEKWPFGLDEFLRFCREIGAEPLITCSDYVLPAEEMPRHLAELVEYLNAPATPEHPWAQKRALWGHPDPYGVKYFEIGNETGHGSHKLPHGRRFSPPEYAKFYQAAVTAMKRVDPTIWTSPSTTPTNGELYNDEWHRSIYDNLMPYTDFLAVHLYGPRMPALTPDDAFRAAMAQSEQLTDYIGKFHGEMKKAGRDVPLMVTEFNISTTVGDKRLDRFSFAAALEMADLYRVFLDPANNVKASFYWQIINGAFGALATERERIKHRRPFLTFLEAWGRYAGETMVETTVETCPTQEFQCSGGKIRPAMGTSFQPSRELGTVSLPTVADPELFPAAKGARLLAYDGDSMRVSLKDSKASCYTDFLRIKRPSIPGAGVLELAFEARFLPETGDSGKGFLGLGLCDSRGYSLTKSALAVQSDRLGTGWQPLSGRLDLLPEAKGVTLVFRSEPKGKRSGVLEIRNLRLIARSLESVPAYKLVTAYAARSGDDGRLFAILFNKSLDREFTVRLRVENFDGSKVQAEEYFHPDLQHRFDFKPVKREAAIRNGVIDFTMKPHSMNVFEISR